MQLEKLYLDDYISQLLKNHILMLLCFLEDSLLISYYIFVSWYLNPLSFQKSAKAFFFFLI